MLKKLKLDMKDVVEKYRLNKKYTSEERVKEVQKIVFVDIINKTADQQELLLQLALEIGHPLKVKSIQLKEELEISLQIVLIELIKCKENQNKSSAEQYQTLEAINENSYTVIANKLRQLEMEMSRHRILRFNTKLIDKKILRQLELAKNISFSFIQEKKDAEYVNNFLKSYQEKKTFKKFTFGLFLIYGGLLFRQKKWFNNLNKVYRYGIFGLASALLLILRL